MKKLYANFIFSWLVQVISFLSPLIVMPYLSRVFSVSDFGFLSIVWSISLISLVITEFGFNMAGPYFLSKRKYSVRKVSNYLLSSVIIKAIICLILLFLAVIIYLFFELCSIAVFVSIVLNVIFLTFQLPWFFQGIEEVKNITFITLCSRLSYLLLIFIFIGDDSSVELCIYLLTLSNFLGFLISTYIIFSRHKIILVKQNVRYVKAVLLNTKHFAISRLSVTIYTYFNNLFVGANLGAASSAIYTCSEKLYSAGQSITSPVATVLYPYLNRTKDKALFYKVLVLTLIPIISGVIFSMIYAEEILMLVFGEKYSEGGDILRIFLIISIINYLSVNYGYPALALKNKINVANASVIYGAILQISFLFAIYWFYDFTVIKMVVSILIVEIFVLLYRVFFYYRG
ncbi:oligosaccharide flippase family protein [Vibrio cholerae]|uniref:oligosaccharide flippase family protein n=1 Tax=Vibrio cholerae TaxID=666 RepID=UPI0030159AAB